MKRTLAYILGAMMILGLISGGVAFATEEAPLYTYGQYDMTYQPGTTDTVTNMPENETGLTPGSDNPYTVSSTVPVREGYEFIDWELTWGTMEQPVDYSNALTVSKKATAAAAGDANTARAYTITLESKVNINADNPTGLFVENLTVTDTIEDEFALNSATAEILDSAGSVISSNTVSAPGPTVTHDFGNVQHGQTARLILEVTAQPDFIGSNGVYTNVGLSGWTYKHTEPGATAAEEYSMSCADKPQVNVPIVFSVNERGQDGVNVFTGVSTFDGKNIPIPAHNAAKKYDQTSGTFSYEWDLFHSEGTAKPEDWGAWYHEHSWPAYPRFPQDYPGLDEIQWPDVDYNYTFAANIPVADTIHINNGRPDVSEEALSAMVSTNWDMPPFPTLGRYKVVLHVTFTPDAVAGEGVFADATTAEPVTADTKDGYLIYTLLPVRSSIDIEPDF